MLDRDRIREAMDELHKHGEQPLSTASTAQELDRMGVVPEKWKRSSWFSSLKRVVGEIHREKREDGLPRYMQTADSDDDGKPQWSQPDFLGPEDWQHDIDRRAEQLADDAEALDRMLDAYEARFGNRYQPDALKRYPGLVYGDDYLSSEPYE